MRTGHIALSEVPFSSERGPWYSRGLFGLSATEVHSYIHPSHDAGSLEGVCVASNKDVRLKSLAREQGTDKLAIYTWTVTFI